MPLADGRPAETAVMAERIAETVGVAERRRMA
jgi:hypothetical protein